MGRRVEDGQCDMIENVRFQRKRKPTSRLRQGAGTWLKSSERRLRTRAPRPASTAGVAAYLPAVFGT